MAPDLWQTYNIICELLLDAVENGSKNIKTCKSFWPKVRAQGRTATKNVVVYLGEGYGGVMKVYADGKQGKHHILMY